MLNSKVTESHPDHAPKNVYANKFVRTQNWYSPSIFMITSTYWVRFELSTCNMQT